MPMGSHKKSGTTFCGKPVCVRDVQCPKGAMTEAQKGLRERNMSLYSVRNYLLADLDESQGSIIWCKKTDFRRSAEDWHPCNKQWITRPATKESCSYRLHRITVGLQIILRAKGNFNVHGYKKQMRDSVSSVIIGIFKEIIIIRLLLTRHQGRVSQQSLACRALKSPSKIHWVNDTT